MDSLEYTEGEVRDSKFSLLRAVEWTFRIAALLLLVYSIYLITTDQLWIVSLGYVSSVTVGCVGGIMLLLEICLSIYQRMEAMNAMVFSVLFAASFVWSYEIIYYLSFPGSLTITTISQLGDGLRTIAVSGIQLLPIILLRKRLILRRISIVLLVIFSVMWIFWILYGFPQYYTPNYLGSTMYPKFFVASDPYHASLYFNFGTKAVLGVFFVSLLKLPYGVKIRAFAESFLHERS